MRFSVHKQNIHFHRCSKTLKFAAKVRMFGAVAAHGSHLPCIFECVYSMNFPPELFPLPHFTHRSLNTNKGNELKQTHHKENENKVNTKINGKLFVNWHRVSSSCADQNDFEKLKAAIGQLP